MISIKAYFDGACKGNPGPSGAGYYFQDEKTGKVISQHSLALGIKTNNQAEWLALIGLLTEAQRYWFGTITILGDSNLIINQVSQKWKIKKPHLQELADRAWELEKTILDKGISIFYKWIPREQNTLADKLSNRF